MKTHPGIIINDKTYPFAEANTWEMLEKSEEPHLHELGVFLRSWFDSHSYILQQTSGSTGSPKMVLLNKAHMRHSARLTIQHFALQPGMIALLCMSPIFIGGRMMVVRSIEAQMNLLVLRPEDNPLRRLHLHVDFAAMVPFQFSRILSETPDKLNLIRHLILGGSPLSPELEQRALQLPTNIWHTYGMSETLSHIALRKVNGPDRMEAFKPLDGVRVTLDERNCLIIDVPQLGCNMLKTNDLAFIRPDGLFEVLGRIDNVVISAGQKIHPEIVERQISHLFPMPFVVIGLPNAEAGETLTLVLQGRPSPRQLSDYWKAMEKLLASAQMPRKIVCVDQLPLLGSGKPDLRALKQQLQAH